MENFFTMRAEKQEHIISAAFAVFGRQGYKKASVADIAEAAGITKGMVTYYFGSKKNLYLYLAELGQKIIADQTRNYFNEDALDFFDKIHMVIEIKVAAIKKYPALLQFFISMFSEQDKEIASEIKLIFDKGHAFRNRLLQENTDFSMFKEGINPGLIVKFLDWAAKGLIADLQMMEDAEKFDEFVNEFYELLGLMKTLFYGTNLQSDAD